jgi:hypothetical protein
VIFAAENVLSPRPPCRGISGQHLSTSRFYSFERNRLS